VALFMIIDQRSPTRIGASDAATPSTTVPPTGVEPSIPLDNRICGLAQRVLLSLPPGQPEAVHALAGFYGELATFTDGELRGDFAAAGRFYKEVDDIGRKGQWDLDRIVRNRDGDRWRALMTGMPTGVQESRVAVRDRCRIEPPEPPSIEIDARGRIVDPLIAKLLAPAEREIYRPPPPPPEETEPPPG
jgi:hypothetical protein